MAVDVDALKSPDWTGTPLLGHLDLNGKRLQGVLVGHDHITRWILYSVEIDHKLDGERR